jgi:hypothetical protein
MKYAFVTGMGRSGTAFLASLLSHSAGGMTRHEYIGDREYWLLSYYLPGSVYATPYLERVKKDIEKDMAYKYFIDINGYLQNSVAELRSVFNPVKVYHLVRDGRAVVRSIYSRRMDSDMQILPRDRNGVEFWLDNSKFEQVCWNWANTTTSLIEENADLLQFEKLTSDYEYVREKVIEPLGLEISREVWSNKAGRRVNKTRTRTYRYLYAKLKGREFVKDELPAYRNWDAEKKKIFRDICGDAMERAGYNQESGTDSY